MIAHAAAKISKSNHISSLKKNKNSGFEAFAVNLVFLKWPASGLLWQILFRLERKWDSFSIWQTNRKWSQLHVPWEIPLKCQQIFYLFSLCIIQVLCISFISSMKFTTVFIKPIDTPSVISIIIWFFKYMYLINTRQHQLNPFQIACSFFDLMSLFFPPPQ